MSAPTTGILTEIRTAMWNAVNACEVLEKAFAKKYREDRDIEGLLLSGVSVSDLPALLITGTAFTAAMQTYSLEEWPIPFRVDLYMPTNRWSTAELRVEQVIWAIRNQAPGGDDPVPYIRRLCADVMRVGPVTVLPALLQQASPLAAAVNQIPAQQQQRCIVASATLLVNPVRNPFA